MKWFLFVMGLVWVVFGTLMVFSVGSFREKYASMVKGVDHRVWSPLALAAGVLFLLAASSSAQPTFIVILGLLALAKGLVLLLGPREKVRSMILWFIEFSDQAYRIWGIFAFLLGVVVLALIVQ
jgi:uncharacterized protein YjeT (DUF2065 family)